MLYLFPSLPDLKSKHFFSNVFAYLSQIQYYKWQVQFPYASVFLRLSVAAHALFYLVRSMNRVIKHLKVRKRRANVFHVNSWINFRRQLRQTFCLAAHVETSTQFV